MSTLIELEGRADALSEKMARVWEEAGKNVDFSQVKSVEGHDSDAKLASFRALNAELDEVMKELLPMRADRVAAEKAKQIQRDLHEPRDSMIHAGGNGTNGKSAPGPVQYKSVGQMFVESKAYLESRAKRDPVDLPDFDVKDWLGLGTKALFDTATGYPVENVRGPRLVMPVEYELRIAALPFQSTTTQQAIVFMRETTTTHNATEVAEGAAKPESAYAYTEESSPVRKIATWIPVTDEALEDVPRIEALLSSRLRYAVLLRLDSQMVAGNGTAPNLRGVLNVVGIQTQAKGADPTPDAIHKAITKVQVVGGKNPDVVVMHPYDFQRIRLLHTTDGIYIWGAPMDAGPMRIWGYPILSTPAVPEGTGVVGAWRESSELAMRKGLTFSTTDSHDDYFIKNLQVILAELRAAFLVHSPLGFCTVTGINV